MMWETIFFWAIGGALALAVVALLLMALLRGPRKGAADAGFDVAVYRQQLSEVDRDLARGVVSDEEAERVRLEVSRRLLEADRAGEVDRAAGAAPLKVSQIGAAVIGVAVLIATWGLYQSLGNPGLADLPLKNRIANADAARENRPSQAEMETRNPIEFQLPAGVAPEYLDLMEKLRAAVAENPDDLQGQLLLAQNEAKLGDYRAAHPAFAKVIALKGAEATESDYSTYLHLLVLAGNGYVSPEAEAAAHKALEFDARNGAARYYLGLMYAQSGRPDQAYALWRPLLAESRPQAPWVPPIMAQIEQVAQAAGIRYTPPRAAPALPNDGLSGPTAEDMQAAGEMDAEDRQAMIRGMVEGLAERLATEGGGPAEWARLINALGVLGETDRAAAIWAEAQVNFADDAEGLAAIRAAAERAGVAQ